MIVTIDEGAAEAVHAAPAAWRVLLERDQPIPAGDLLNLIRQANAPNPAAPIPIEAARAAFRIFWQAQLDALEPG